MPVFVFDTVHLYEIRFCMIFYLRFVCNSSNLQYLGQYLLFQINRIIYLLIATVGFPIVYYKK